MKTAQLQLNPEGVPYSGEFDDIYHSSDGGLGQAQHVFMAGNGLPARWQGQKSFTILETGFGLGLSFLATWQAWREDPDRCERLNFISVEKFPFTAADLARLHTQWPQFAALSSELVAQWPWLTPGFHRITLDGGRVILTLLLDDAREQLSKLIARVDAIYLDGFAPSKNPEMWSLPLFKRLWRVSHAETTLATYTVAGQVRRDLTEAGFAVKRVRGFGGKRHMLTGRVARTARSLYPPTATEQHAIVIGAGLAGCNVSTALARRGWRVTLIEAESDIATRASGNHAGLMHPALSLDDNLLSRLSRAGFAATLAQLRGLGGVAWGETGVLQMADSEKEAARLKASIERNGLPPEYARWLDAQDTQEIGINTEWGGVWYEHGAWVQPASLCRALLAQSSRIDLRLHTPVARLQKNEEGWQVFDAGEQIIASAPTLILANATAARQFFPDLPLGDQARSVTRLAANSIQAPAFGISGSAYLTPDCQGERCIGAAEVIDGDLSAAQFANLNQLARLFPSTTFKDIRTRACARPVSHDRMPLIGAVLAESGLYTALGFGSRGITWSALAGETIASLLHTEPLPISRDLYAAIEPSRFARRQSHQTTS